MQIILKKSYSYIPDCTYIQLKFSIKKVKLIKWAERERKRANAWKESKVIFVITEKVNGRGSESIMMRLDASENS